jgi:hypothetical protein
MSKKLIAVAAAAALALTGLVGVAPASATAPNIALTTTGSTGTGTSADPYLVDVPAANLIQTATSNTAITFTIGGTVALAAGDVVTVTASGPVKVLRSAVTVASANFDASTLGLSTISSTRTNADTMEFFAYTTSSTVAGTVVVNIVRSSGTTVNTSSTYHIQGVAGPKHTVNVVTAAPLTLANGATATVGFTVSDVFGNLVENEAAAVSADNTRVQMGAPTWSASKKVYESVVTSNSNGALVASLDIGAATVLGMKAPADSLAAVINNPTATAQAASLTAQVAALTAQLAASVSKAKFNKLAKRWNRANPSNRVKLVK